jgi:exopolysaccharide biosynthesis WecB/TagA/CpsF family protein
MSAGDGIVELMGVALADMGVRETAAALAARPPDAPFGYVLTPNADNFVRLDRDPVYRALYRHATLRVLDSRVVARAARLLGLGVPRVCPGSDLTAALLRDHVRPGERVAVIGLRAEYLDRLVEACGIARPFHHDPPMGFDRDPAAFRAAIEFVIAHPARLVFIAVGAPKQERLAAAVQIRGAATGTGLCVGASLDFLAGARRRAPRWMQRGGLEWLFRLVSDPRRLARRYLLEDPPVFRMLLRARLGLPVPAKDSS